MRKMLLGFVCAVALFGAIPSNGADLKTFSKGIVGLGIAYVGVRVIVINVLGVKNLEKLDKTIFSSILISFGFYLASDLIKSVAESTKKSTK